ncbi:histone deacetylase family protein [Schlesneria sp.]|uniref:histone deacetylase family protein n=1 Tax=Schlesneria sp. TaxID=2762018 RepID=UPI002F057856
MTVLYMDERFLGHETGKHRECPERLVAIRQELIQSGLDARCTLGKPRVATVDELAQIHGKMYVGRVADFADEGGGWIEGDTFMSPKSYEVARLAAGTALAAVDSVVRADDDRRALCLIRPPGHHALADDAMGFCLFNNIALAADHAIKQHHLNRVLVVDWDVHHGNGTQDIFYQRDDVWFLSAHRSPFYPGTGQKDETGTGKGLGATFNLPLPFGTSRKHYLSGFESLLNDAAKRCRPELILVSAGFDAHTLDPIGSLGLETEDFQALTKMVIDVAETYSGGRLVSCLEGGYHIQKLAECVSVHLKTLLEFKAA